MTIIIAATLAIVCFAVALTGFTSMGDITDAKQAADARGFAWFWAFLGSVATAFGLLSVWLLRTQKDGEG